MSPEQQKKYFLIFAILLIALNLRPSIAGVGPLIGEIRDDTGLSNSMLGLLTTLPVLAFGLFSVLTPLFTRKLGTEGTMAFALVLLTAGILLRVAPAISALYIGTLILGIGIALGNVLLPGIVKKRFTHRYGMVTGLYSAMLGVGATIASGISVPLSEGAGFGWRWALGAWALISVLGLIFWMPQMKGNIPEVTKRGLKSSLKALGKSKLAWHVAVFVGLQSLTFYTIIAWLPEILIERGMSAGRAGWMLALTQGVGVVGTFILPSLISKTEKPGALISIIVALEVASILGLILLGNVWVPVLVSVLGFCLGGSFGLALLFIVLRSRDTESANELSGMAQSIGYSFAAAGPVLFGALYDMANTWTIPLSFLLIIALFKLWTGIGAGREEYV